LQKDGINAGIRAATINHYKSNAYSHFEQAVESAAAKCEPNKREATFYLPFGFRLAFGLAFSAFSAAKG
jgi:hypothetical protein